MLINFRSFKFKPGFLLMMVVLVLVAQTFFSFWQITAFKEKISQIQTGNVQTEQLLMAIGNQVHVADLRFEKYLISKNESDINIWENTWSKAILPAVDQLEQFQQNPVVFKSLQANVKDLKQIQQNALNDFNYFYNDSLSRPQAVSFVIENFQEPIQQNFQKVNDDLSYWKAKLVAENKAQNASLYGQLKQNFYISLVILLIVIVPLLLFFSKGFSGLTNDLRNLEKSMSSLSRGNLPKNRIATTKELKPIFVHVNQLSQNFSKIRQFALAIGEGKFEHDINVFERKGDVGSSLSEMTTRLRNVAESEKQRIWMNEGFAKFGDLLRKNSHDLEHMTEQAISQLVKYCDLNQGALFIKEDDAEGAYLYLSGCYAYNRKKHLQAKIRPGEDLVGQCFLEKDSIFLT
ncbi:MAG: hypothetical protein ACOCXH_10050, partial [Cyclobacteriaceae bacterium]